MRSIIFSYTRLGRHFVPIIPVTLFSRSLAFKTEAYVYSGAFCSIFRREILDALQLRKEQGQLKMLKAADGDFIPGYLFRLPVQIGEVKLAQSLLSYLAPKHRTIMELIYYRDHTKDEVAKQLKLPLGTVKTRHRMALQQLKGLFKQDIHHFQSHK